MTLKTGPHYMLNGSGYGDWLAAGCTVAKACLAYPTDDPRGALLIGRAANTDYINPDGDAIKRARDMFDNAILPTARANPHIKVWEGANEPGWSYQWPLTQMQYAMSWYGAFDAELCRLGDLNGLRMVVGNWAVATPGRTGSHGENLNDLWRHYQQGLDAIRRGNHYHGSHMYGPLDEVFALRYRANHRQFIALGYPDIRHVLTEVGAEHAGPMKPWREQYGDSIQRYLEDWIKPFELAIRTDPYVVGACLYTIGDGGDAKWRPYNVAGTRLPALMFELSRELGPLPQAPILTLPSRPDTYIVRAGDTLTAIARAFAISNWRQLAELNGIVDPRTLRPGTALKLPQPAGNPPPPADPPPASTWQVRVISADEWGRPKLHAWQAPNDPVMHVAPNERDALVVHHTVTADNDPTPNVFETETEVLARVRAIDQYHRNKGYGGIGYSWLFAPLANRTVLIVEGRGNTAFGIHAGNLEFNRNSIGLAVLGDYRRPFDLGDGEWIGVMEVVNQFLRMLRTQLPRLGDRRSPRKLMAWGHREVPGTATECPGAWLHERLRLFAF